MNQKNLAKVKLGDLDPSHTNPTGDPSVGYPQICIRTNRTAERTDLDAVIKTANEVAAKYPDDKEERGKQVMAALSSMFGGGGFGHAWIIIFHSETEGDCDTYAYHDEYGYVHNGDTNGKTNDTPQRGFAYQRIVPIDAGGIERLEKLIIPGLNAVSDLIGAAMGNKPAEGRHGVYSALNNCSWFAGNVWKYSTSDKLIYEQEFPGKEYAESWGIDALIIVSEVADPGMIAESLAK